MTNFVPAALVRADDLDDVVDAVYFVVRALRNVRRNYPKVEISSESSSTAHRLAEIALDEIETAEQKDIRALPIARIDDYLSSLQTFVSHRIGTQPPSMRSEAEQFLREMRRQSEAGYAAPR